MYIEPKVKHPNEQWTVESGDCPIEHVVHATFGRREAAAKYRDDLNAKGGNTAYIGTMPHNPS